MTTMPTSAFPVVILNTNYFFFASDWKRFVERDSRGWLTFYHNWFTQKMPIYIAQYEKTKEDTESQVRGLGAFLGVSESALHNTTHMNCVVDQESNGKLKRNKLKITSSPYSEEMKKRIWDYIERIQRLAKNQHQFVLNFTLPSQ